MESSNVKAMRDALLNIQEYAAAMDVDDGNVLAILDACRDALAAPPRNCDMGTAEEQDKRFSYQFCRVGIDGCVRCKLNVLLHRGNTCGIHWAQMPYEAQEGVKK